jgi:hypothetical protein
MARYILIDNASGYIWGDSADIGGKIVNGTPIQVAKALDASVGLHTPRAYEIVSRGELASNETGYHVYRADIGGSEAVPIVQDGQDMDMIAAVERDCEYVATIRCDDAEPA